MNIADTISFQLKVWQLFGLSNLGHMATKKLMLYRNSFMVLTTLGQLSGIHRMLTKAAIYRHSFGHLLYSLLTMCFSATVRLINMIIFVELFARVDRQNLFLYKITKIDCQFKERLNIDVNYPHQKQRYDKLFLRSFLIVVVPYGINGIGQLALGLPLGVHTFLGAIALQLVTLRFNQYSTFADMIGWRYSLINRYINEFYAVDASQWIIHADRPISTIPTAIHLQRLHDIDMICRRLNKASEHANQLFPWSLSLCVFHEFCAFFIYGQDVVKFLFKYAHGRQYSWAAVSVFYCMASVNNLLTLATVCDHAYNEVG